MNSDNSTPTGTTIPNSSHPSSEPVALHDSPILSLLTKPTAHLSDEELRNFVKELQALRRPQALSLALRAEASKRLTRHNQPSVTEQTTSQLDELYGNLNDDASV